MLPQHTLPNSDSISFIDGPTFIDITWFYSGYTHSSSARLYCEILNELTGLIRRAKWSSRAFHRTGKLWSLLSIYSGNNFTRLWRMINSSATRLIPRFPVKWRFLSLLCHQLPSSPGLVSKRPKCRRYSLKHLYKRVAHPQQRY